MIKSQALEANIAAYHVEVLIDPRYEPILEVFKRYEGLTEKIEVFLKELSHPYKNWMFIVEEARGYVLDYFHLLKDHPDGSKAAGLFIDIFLDAFFQSKQDKIRIEAADDLMLFLYTIASKGGGSAPFLKLLDSTFLRLTEFGEKDFFFFVTSYYPLEKIASSLVKEGPDAGFSFFNRLYFRYLFSTYFYWKRMEDPLEVFVHELENGDEVRKQIDGIFLFVSHRSLEKEIAEVRRIEASCDHDLKATTRLLNKRPGFSAIVDSYRKIPEKLFAAAPNPKDGNQWKILFLFHMMHLSGLSQIHEEILREINSTVRWLIAHESDYHISRLVKKTFQILKTKISRYPLTALNCVLNMGKGIYNTGSFELVNGFIDHVVDLGFQPPGLQGVGNDWQIKANTYHITNIRTWMQLIELKPKWSTKLISYLIIHLALFGVFIKDTDLFPKDITRFLNSDIEPVYNLVKQLARLFPSYFNDIGAEGKLREISTELDEITHRKDVLIHFLRKQSHVESNNQILLFMEEVFRFWATRDKTGLKPYVPPNIYEEISVAGPYIDGVFLVMQNLLETYEMDDLLNASEEEIKSALVKVKDAGEIDRKRVALLFAFHKHLNLKYRISFSDTEDMVSRLQPEAFPELERLKEALKQNKLKKKIFLLLEYLARLQNIIFSPRRFEVREDIYKKRHFAADIPSMYGSYHEMKFDAMGLTLRIESLVNVLFEELIDSFDLKLITKAVLDEIYDILILFAKALRVDGIISVEFERQLDLLSQSIEIKGFTLTQYLDIFKGFAQAVRNVINDYFHNVHGENLSSVLQKTDQKEILPKFMPKDDKMDGERVCHRISEIFFRDRIALSLGLQHLDLFVGRILNTLYYQAEELPPDRIRQLLIYDPNRILTTIENVKSHVSSIIHLGNKGFNLVKLTNFGLPVPPGFIVTTELFRYRDLIENYPPAKENFKAQVVDHLRILESRTHKRFGDPRNPLLISARSGSSISQPGMMDTFLNVGINEEIAEGLSRRTDNPWFAWDNYRRYLQCLGMSFGLSRDDFDQVMADHKKRLGIPLKRDFSGEQMRRVAADYRRMIRDSKIQIPEDPMDQLFLAINRVLASWDSAKAKTYRKIMGISDDWGTAVTLQAMVYGNISINSGSGVFFTHNPRWSEDSLNLWGDFTTYNQGEDIVSGLVKTLPISIKQQETEMRETDITLESHFPEIYNALKRWASDLVYDKGWSPQEMEFTFESNRVKDLYILQTRDMAIRERKQVMIFDPLAIQEESLLGHGIGVSGGAMSGRIVFNINEIEYWREKEPDCRLILVRSDTVPDDIREIFAADGLLTARGGLTSHAAVVAHQLGKTCVVGCAEMICDEKNGTLFFQKTVLKAGDKISVDGRRGAVYKGYLSVV